jgi:two-component system nitrate/nitrite response regulator NarL
VVLRCLIVDDSPPFRQAARGLPESEHITVVGVASTGAEDLALSKQVLPDVILVDIDLAGEGGFEVVRRLVGLGAQASGVTLISSHSKDGYADLIAASPATGFLSKTALSATAIEDVLGLRDDGGLAGATVR